ncbi:MAG TPA: hypothetical protein VF862_12060 [Gemmatimonadales bacterium]
MNRLSYWRSLVAAVAVAGTMAGCSGDLDVENPNAPDAKRAFSDPGTIASVASGTIRQWAVTRQEYNSGLVLNTMADHASASWNNFNLRYYTSYGNECPQRCGWANTLTSSFYIQLETYWYGYYGALSAVNDALTAIRKNNVIITDGPTTRMVETISVMMQGFVFGGIALNYDQGFIVDEETDLADPLGLPLATRQELRDAAIAKLDEAYQLAQANSFVTPAGWAGESGGRSYTNLEIAKLIRTVQAEILAQYPRDAAENGQVNWAQVRTYASQGLSAAGGTDFQIHVDNNRGVWYDGVKDWTNQTGTMKVDTRLAAIITDGPDPAKVHVTPWPSPQGNPQPDAYDKRVGDGSWGPIDNYQGVLGKAAGPKAGSDFAWHGSSTFPAARGQYHQSNLQHMRYSYLTYAGYGLPGEDGTGQADIITATYNDLLWAEGELRGGGSKATAAQLINKTRVTRGGLAPLTGAESDAVLLRALQYEQAVELYGLGGVPFYNSRRTTPAGYSSTTNAGCPGLLCLWPDTPRHMPIPAKELGLLKKELYSFGGPVLPEASAGVNGSEGRVKSAREIAAELTRASLEMRKRGRRQ